MRVHTFAEAKARYGEIEGSDWKGEGQWCTFIPVPAGITIVNTVTGKLLHQIYCNKDMAAALTAALEAAVEFGVAHELESYDGCLMVRVVRGSLTDLSTHAFALAIDFNAKKFPLGTKTASFSREFVRCFTDRGFTWGGDFKRCDPMHFSYAWEGPAT